ncbi:hypothetical protein BDP27DRAFT_650528 [Rhodocollybia butyracea]|uniref:Uncharacterized protein n=1 Tax=Rhodocollybia butyracea TaxID=206335 RepID=A0A9P5P632_9AGAR|nr:hypothetical protein BDP27DRAFT_650528 [Rhodocollybia butyracea]
MNGNLNNNLSYHSHSSTNTNIDSDITSTSTSSGVWASTSTTLITALTAANPVGAQPTSASASTSTSNSTTLAATTTTATPSYTTTTDTDQNHPSGTLGHNPQSQPSSTPSPPLKWSIRNQSFISPQKLQEIKATTPTHHFTSGSLNGIGEDNTKKDSIGNGNGTMMINKNTSNGVPAPAAPEKGPSYFAPNSDQAHPRPQTKPTIRIRAREPLRSSRFERINRTKDGMFMRIHRRRLTPSPECSSIYGRTDFPSFISTRRSSSASS